MLDSIAQHYQVDIYTPFKDLPEHVQKVFLYGSEEEEIRFYFDTDSKRHFYKKSFEGIIPELSRKYYETGKFGWYILKWEEPAPSFGNVSKTYILHPNAFNGGPKRVISVKEALLIMGFDNDFRFPERTGIKRGYQMVADAVSPVFAYVSASIIKEMLSD